MRQLTFYRSASTPHRKIVDTYILEVLRAGFTPMVYKTNALPVGKRLVSVGRYCPAVGPRKWQVIDGAESFVYSSIYDAIRAYVETVGKDYAYQSAREAKING